MEIAINKKHNHNIKIVRMNPQHLCDETPHPNKTAQNSSQRQLSASKNHQQHFKCHRNMSWSASKLTTAQQQQTFSKPQRNSHKNNAHNNNVQWHNERQMWHKKTSRNESHRQTFSLPCRIHFQQKETSVATMQCPFGESRRMSLCRAFQFLWSNLRHQIAKSRMHPTMEQWQHFEQIIWAMRWTQRN